MAANKVCQMKGMQNQFSIKSDELVNIVNFTLYITESKNLYVYMRKSFY